MGLRVRWWAAALAIAPRVAHAHPGRAPAPHDLWRAWTIAPVVIVGIVLAAWFYARGVRTLWRRAGRGGGVARWRAACFGGGLLAVAIALLSPVDAVGSALFSVHMVQHLLLVLVAAPLLVMGEPHTAMLWALPVRGRRAVGRAWRRAPGVRTTWRHLRQPLVAWTLHAAALWAWHTPRLYDAALRDPGVHELEHATFFLTALLFWWVVADRHARRLGLGVIALYLFAASLQGTLLGALIAVARHPLYAAHAGTTAAWGLTPLEDQQLAGLIMWVPAGVIYLAALVPFAVRALAGGRAATAEALPAAAPRPG